MNDLKKFQHGEEGTHYACEIATSLATELNEDLECCGCSGHKCKPQTKTEGKNRELRKTCKCHCHDNCEGFTHPNRVMCFCLPVVSEHCEAKTQGKILDRFDKKFPHAIWMDVHTKAGDHQKFIVKDLRQFILKEQNDLLERVLEIVGDDEWKDPAHVSNQDKPYLRQNQIIRNELRHDIKKSIDELKKSL